MTQKRKKMLAKLGAAIIVLSLIDNVSAVDKPAATVSTDNASTANTVSSVDNASATNKPLAAENTSTVDDASTTDNEQPMLDTKKDPYEPFNRVMYNFNDFIDNAVLKPIATFYNKVTPKPLSKGIKNIYSNIDTIPTVINDALQGNAYQTASDAWRLTINSTIGILGFFDFAADMGLEPNKEDFGLTLARWGYTDSNYLVLPFFGPSTPRDAIGIPVDYYVFSIYPYIYPKTQRYELYGLGVIARRADLLSYENVMEQASIDKYAFLRDAYLQRRAYLIQRNKELGDPYLEKNKQEKNS